MCFSILTQLHECGKFCIVPWYQYWEFRISFAVIIPTQMLLFFMLSLITRFGLEACNPVHVPRLQTQFGHA